MMSWKRMSSEDVCTKEIGEDGVEREGCLPGLFICVHRAVLRMAASEGCIKLAQCVIRRHADRQHVLLMHFARRLHER